MSKDFRSFKREKIPFSSSDIVKRVTRCVSSCARLKVSLRTAAILLASYVLIIAFGDVWKNESHQTERLQRPGDAATFILSPEKRRTCHSGLSASNIVSRDAAASNVLEADVATEKLFHTFDFKVRPLSNII
jgi:hypothetical protein